MYKKISILLVVFFISIFGFGVANAQEDVLVVEEETAERYDILTEVGKQVIFDVSEVTSEYENYREYHWDFGDGGSAEGMGVLHSYLHPGYYEASLNMRLTDDDQKKLYINVYVYNNLLLGVVDNTIDEDKISEVEQTMFDRGMLLWVLKGEEKNVVSEELVDIVLENTDLLEKSEGMVLWGPGNFGLDFALQLKQRSDVEMSELDIISVSNQSFTSIKKTADSVFNLINPRSLLLVKENSLESLGEYIDVESWTNVLTDEGVGFELIGLKDKFRSEPPSKWYFLSSMINFALFSGVPLSTITLILLMPLIALLLAVARQVVGIKAFGIYVPALITLAFLESGLRYGAIVFLIILAVGTLARLLLKKIRILYLPRMALILTFVALGMLLIMYLAAYFNIVGLKTLSIVPLLTMVILTEKFVSAQIRYGFGSAIKLTFETFILSTICYLVLSWETLRALVISYPEMVLLVIPLLVILGRWSGLRLSEYWRFRRLMK